MKYEPKDYQVLAEKHILKNPAAGLFLDMGLGKTVVTLTAIQKLIYDYFCVSKVLIIAPKKVAEDTWVSEIEKWDHLRGLTISQVLGSAADREAALRKDTDLYIINRENVIWLVERLKKKWFFDMIVIDELSSFKSCSAKRFKALRRVRPLSKRIVGLTGTPNPNGYADLWSELYLLDMGQRLYQTVTNYRDSYLRPGKRKGSKVFSWELKRGAKEEIDRRISDICISMKVESSLQDIVEIPVYVRMTDKEKALYDELGEYRVLHLYETNLDGVTTITAPTKSAIYGKLTQMANGFVYDEYGKAHNIHSHKLEMLDELIEGLQGESALVCYWFKEDKNRILKKFPQAVDFGKGDTKQIVSDWNAGKIPILLCHPASAGHGLNLQFGGHVLIWYSLPPGHLELFQQANKRLHRPGQDKTVRVYYILTRNTFDEPNLKGLGEKAQVQESLLKALNILRGWRKNAKDR